MGILDYMLGTGQGSGSQTSAGPFQPGALDRLQATLTPQGYAARMQGFNQQNIYNQMQPRAGNADAMAMATDPQAYQMGAGAYLPQAPVGKTSVDASGQQIPYQEINQGGGAGHGLSISGMPINAPPGTTTNPAAQPTQIGGGDTLSRGMPGGLKETMQRVEDNKAAGRDPFEGLPPDYKKMTSAVLNGQQTLKDVIALRGAPIRNVINDLALAVDPNFSESKNEARNTYLKSYFSGGAPGTIGFKKEALGTTFQHLNTTLDAALAMKNVSGGFAPAVNLSNMANSLGTQQGASVNAFNTAKDFLADETVKFITGKPPTEGNSNEYKSRWNAYADPRTIASTAEKYLELVEGKIHEMEDEKNNNFKGTTMGDQFPIELEQHRAMAAQIRAKIKTLKGETPEAPGGGAVKNYKDYF